ncbi:hypothetical protein DFH11DRAFT_1832634 [Phellopilus nigrolimitatus]|nr:hypothetical protein DFH11DRAFT_1832634 [Phellopilus nigrolimitatus]
MAFHPAPAAPASRMARYIHELKQEVYGELARAQRVRQHQQQSRTAPPVRAHAYGPPAGYAIAAARRPDDGGYYYWRPGGSSSGTASPRAPHPPAFPSPRPAPAFPSPRPAPAFPSPRPAPPAPRLSPVYAAPPPPLPMAFPTPTLYPAPPAPGAPYAPAPQAPPMPFPTPQIAPIPFPTPHVPAALPPTAPYARAASPAHAVPFPARLPPPAAGSSCASTDGCASCLYGPPTSRGASRGSSGSSGSSPSSRRSETPSCRRRGGSARIRCGALVRAVDDMNVCADIVSGWADAVYRARTTEKPSTREREATELLAALHAAARQARAAAQVLLALCRADAGAGAAAAARVLSEVRRLARGATAMLGHLDRLVRLLARTEHAAAPRGLLARVGGAVGDLPRFVVGTCLPGCARPLPLGARRSRSGGSSSGYAALGSGGAAQMSDGVRALRAAVRRDRRVVRAALHAFEGALHAFRLEVQAHAAPTD